MKGKDTKKVLVKYFYHGTAMCYRFDPSGVWAGPSDFMALETHYTHLDQLRGISKRKAKIVDLPKTARPDDGFQTPRRTEWQGHSLDDELLVFLGPNLSPEQVVQTLQAIIRSIRSDGLTVAGFDKQGDYYPAFEKLKPLASRENS